MNQFSTFYTKLGEKKEKKSDAVDSVNQLESMITLKPPIHPYFIGVANI